MFDFEAFEAYLCYLCANWCVRARKPRYAPFRGNERDLILFTPDKTYSPGYKITFIDLELGTCGT